jgi:SAM-dependent methyltransferase
MEPAKPRYRWTDPAAYHTFMGRWSERLAQPFLAVATIPPGSRVLDVCCGTGVLTKALAEGGAQVVGIDASAEYLDGARLTRSHPAITYEAGDCRQMRFLDGSFEACVSSLALDVIPEVEQVVAEMKRVTRPGGIVASAVHDFWGGMPAYAMVWDTGAVLDPTMAALRDASKARPIVGAGGLAVLWRGAGLVQVTEVPVVFECVYADFADYWATFISGQGRVSARLMEVPDDVRAEIERHVRAGYLVGLPDGPRSFPMMVRAVRGLVPDA